MTIVCPLKIEFYWGCKCRGKWLLAGIFEPSYFVFCGKIIIVNFSSSHSPFAKQKSKNLSRFLLLQMLYDQLNQVNIKIHQVHKRLHALLNFSCSQFLHALWAKFLHTKTSHGTSNDDRCFHVFK
jgi:hypothetical protein